MMRRGAMSICVAVLFTVGCGGGSNHPATLTTHILTSAQFKTRVTSLYAAFDVSPIPRNFATGAANYDGFADAVAALDVATSEIATRGSIVSAAHAAAAVLRKYQSISDVPTPSNISALFALQTLVHSMPG